MKLRLAMLTLLAVGWLLPFFWAGASLGGLRGKVHPWLWQEYNAAALFTKRTPTWPQMLIQVRLADRAEWQTLVMNELSPMTIAGYRQRLDRLLSDIKGKKIAGEVRQRLAFWVAGRLASLQPTFGKVTGVRFAETIWHVNTPDLAMPQGHWEINMLVLPTTTKFVVLATYQIESGKARLLKSETHDYHDNKRAEPPVRAFPRR